MRTRSRLPLFLLLVFGFLTLVGAPALAQDGEVVTGTLRDAEGEPLPGVSVVVRTAEGDEVGTATSGDDGRWEVELPGPGAYEIELDTATLPEGVVLREGISNPIRADVLGGQQRAVAFPVEGGEAAAAGFLSDIAQPLLNGIKFGLIVAITSIGLSLIFGTTRLINFAHGELVTTGAVVTWFLNVSGGLPLWLAAVITFVLMFGAGAALDRGLWRPLRQRRVGLFQMLVITIGLTLFLQNLNLVIFGGTPRPYSAPYIAQQSLVFGPFRITPRDLTVMALATLVLVTVALMLQHTRIGKAMRAVADNRDLAESSGIDVQKVILVVWALGTALAALGGVFTGVIVRVDFFMGFRLLLLMFAGVILGGLGSAYGAMVGGLAVGLAVELSTVWFPAELKNAWALAVLIIVLLVRPQGLLGRAERIG